MKRVLIFLTTLLLLAHSPLRAQTSMADFVRLDMRHGLPESRVRCLAQTPDGRLIVVTAGTISLYDGTRFHVFNLQPQYAYPLTGVSPSVYIKGIRMSVAQKLLADTDMPVSDIAIKTGFSTTKYFSSSFKDTFGLTPAEYREQQASTGIRR